MGGMLGEQYGLPTEPCVIRLEFETWRSVDHATELRFQPQFALIPLK